MRLQPFRAAALAAAVACAGLVAAGVPPAAAYAARITHAPRVKLSPRTGPPTSTVRVSGSGFAAYRAVDIYFGTTDEALAATNGNGAFSGIRIRVPASAVPGRHYITAVQRHSGRAAQARFLVNTNWAQDRYSAGRSGLNPYENVLSPSNVSGLGLDWWRVASGSTSGFRSSPAVVNGVVYAGYMNGTVNALNAATGTGKWSYNTGSMVESSPAVANGIVYAEVSVPHGAVFGGALYALNAVTGAEEWSYTTGYTTGSPAVANGVVYIGSDTGVHALNAATGAEEWSNTTGDSYFSSPAVANGAVYIGADHVYAFGLPGRTRAVSRPASGQLHPNYALHPQNSTNS
jgi:hypothetical protein